MILLISARMVRTDPDGQRHAQQIERPPCAPISRARRERPTAQLIRNSRYQQLAEGIERTDPRELERHQMDFAESQLLQHGVRCLSVGHIQNEDDTRPVFQRILLVDLAIQIELRGLANLGRRRLTISTVTCRACRKSVI